MSYTVRFSPEAAQQLAELEDFIVAAGSPMIAARFVDAIVEYCECLATFPERGIRRDDLMSGMRVTNYRGSTVIAFLVDREAEIVSIIGVYYGGQDYATLLQVEPGH